MSNANCPPPASAQPREVLRGLDATEAGRPAHEVLSAIVWEGPAMDPDVTKAKDFLAQL
jgi:hypothetical protein